MLSTLYTLYDREGAPTLSTLGATLHIRLSGRNTGPAMTGVGGNNNFSEIFSDEKYFRSPSLPPPYLSLLFQYKKSGRDGWVLSRLEPGQMGMILKHSFRRYKTGEGEVGEALHTSNM